MARVGRPGLFRQGACLGNDISGFADPDYLGAAAQAGAAVVATHIRLRPRVADPEPHYDDVTQSVTDFLVERRQWALDAGITMDKIVLDAGLDLGKTAGQSVQLLRDSDVWPRWVRPSCCRRRTRLFSASSSTCRSSNGANRRWRRRRSASPRGVVSFGSMTSWVRFGCATCWRTSLRRVRD